MQSLPIPMKQMQQEHYRYMKRLEAELGARSGGKRYHFTNVDDFAEALIRISAQYIDFYCCWAKMNFVFEQMDNSIEVFYPAEYLNIALQRPIGDQDIAYTLNEIAFAKDSLFDLLMEAEVDCKTAWRLAITYAPDEVLNRVCSRVFRANSEELSELTTFEFYYSKLAIPKMRRRSMSSMARCFGQALEKELNAMRIEKQN